MNERFPYFGYGMKVRATFKWVNREADGLGRKRQEIIEHIFGTIKRQWDMDHTLVKGRQNVETEYRIAAICYNLTRVVSVLGLARLKKKLKKLQEVLLLSFLQYLTTVAYHAGKHLEILKIKFAVLGARNMAHIGQD